MVVLVNPRLVVVGEHIFVELLMELLCVQRIVLSVLVEVMIECMNVFGDQRFIDPRFGFEFALFSSLAVQTFTVPPAAEVFEKPRFGFVRILILLRSQDVRN